MSIQIWLESALNSVLNLWGLIWGSALPLIGAFMILYVGWIIGRLAERMVHTVAVGMAKTDEEISRSGFGVFLRNLGVGCSLGSVFGWLAWAVKWFLYTAFFMAAMSVLAFVQVNTFVAQAGAFLPTAAIGALLIFVGVLFARFLQAVVQTLLGMFKLPGGEITGAVAYWSVLVFAFLGMLSYFGVPFGADIWARVFDMLVIAGGIALGLGLSGRFAEFFEGMKRVLRQ